MGGREDLDRAIKTIMASKRDELGGAPTPEELLAYRDGLLDPAARQSVEERLAVYPDAAQALADLAAFPDLEGAPELPDEEMDARWESFRKRLEEVESPHPPAPSPGPTKHALPGRGGADRGRGWTTATRLAAGLAALAIGFFVGRGTRPDLPASAVNVAIAELSPVEEGGARSVSEVVMPDASEEMMFVLGLLDAREFPDYGAEILGPDGARIWSREGLRPSSMGTFHLAFRRDALPPGTYRIHLFGREGERRTPLATYDLRLVRE
jgi:hypothetical protein